MTNKIEELSWLWFSLLPKIGAQRGKLILGNEESPQKLWEKNTFEMRRVEGLGGDYYSKVIDNAQREKAIELYEKYFSNGFMKMVTILEKDYPILLRETIGAPYVIFYRGNIKLCSMASIGVIGSRKPSAYGVSCTRELTRKLAQLNICVVSGMARGIDSEAHKSALQVGGKTCAILGSGLDVVYPPENERLYDDIVEKGVVLSEYPPETQPLSRNFPARNRLISGLCKGLLVIEAGKKSGTLITADFALEQGRDVFAVPGSIFSPHSVGTNHLIRQGAVLVSTIDDLLDEYSFNNGHTDESNVDYTNIMSGLKGELMNLISKGVSTTDEIIASCSSDIPDIMSELMLLETDGFINKLDNGEYVVDKVL